MLYESYWDQKKKRKFGCANIEKEKKSAQKKKKDLFGLVKILKADQLFFSFSKKRMVFDCDFGDMEPEKMDSPREL